MEKNKELAWHFFQLAGMHMAELYLPDTARELFEEAWEATKSVNMFREVDDEKETT